MNRRRVLQMTAIAAVGLSLPSKRVTAQESGVGSEMAALSDYMAGAHTRALPADVAEQAKDHVLDTIASLISGSDLPPGKAAQRFVHEGGGKGAATVATTKLLAAPADAALANAVMAQADETDDSHNASRSHPGCSVIPAALAVGETFGIGGSHLL